MNVRALGILEGEFSLKLYPFISDIILNTNIHTTRAEKRQDALKQIKKNCSKILELLEVEEVLEHERTMANDQNSVPPNS